MLCFKQIIREIYFLIFPVILGVCELNNHKPIMNLDTKDYGYAINIFRHWF